MAARSASPTRDTTRGILYCCTSFMLVLSQWYGYSHYILTFLPPVLILCISHWVALRIYLRRWYVWNILALGKHGFCNEETLAQQPFLITSEGTISFFNCNLSKDIFVQLLWNELSIEIIANCLMLRNHTPHHCRKFLNCIHLWLIIFYTQARGKLQRFPPFPRCIEIEIKLWSLSNWSFWGHFHPIIAKWILAWRWISLLLFQRSWWYSCETRPATSLVRESRSYWDEKMQRKLVKPGLDRHLFFNYRRTPLTFIEIWDDLLHLPHKLLGISFLPHYFFHSRCRHSLRIKTSIHCWKRRLRNRWIYARYWSLHYSFLGEISFQKGQ